MTVRVEDDEIVVKLQQPWFDESWRGEKPWEMRVLDRDYQVGKALRMCEWSEDSGFGGREIRSRIVAIHTSDDLPWIPEGHGLLGLGGFFERYDSSSETFASEAPLAQPKAAGPAPVLHPLSALRPEAVPCDRCGCQGSDHADGQHETFCASCEEPCDYVPIEVPDIPGLIKRVFHEHEVPEGSRVPRDAWRENQYGVPDPAKFGFVIPKTREAREAIWPYAAASAALLGPTMEGIAQRMTSRFGAGQACMLSDVYGPFWDLMRATGEHVRVFTRENAPAELENRHFKVIVSPRMNPEEDGCEAGGTCFGPSVAVDARPLVASKEVTA